MRPRPMPSSAASSSAKPTSSPTTAARACSTTACATRSEATTSSATRRLGIDNAPLGVTPNDAGDADSGANALQNFPFISSVDYGDHTVTVHGILKASPNTTYDLDFYSNEVCTARPRDFLQGWGPLGSLQVTTNGAGRRRVSTCTLDDFHAPNMPPISATATDPDGNTSEFSQNVVYASSPSRGPGRRTRRHSRPAPISPPARPSPSEESPARGKASSTRPR